MNDPRTSASGGFDAQPRRAGRERVSPRPRRITVPNLLTASRLVLLPVLWALALAGADQALALGTAIAVSTDALDGLIARRFGIRSDFGSRFDSIADHLLSASLLAWLVLLRPELVERFAPWLLLWAAFALVTLAVGWVRFRRIGDLHLYSSKVAMALAYVFGVGVLFFDTYRPWQFWIVLAVGFLAVLEALLVYLTRSDPDERIGSILERRRRVSADR